MKFDSRAIACAPIKVRAPRSATWFGLNLLGLAAGLAALAAAVAWWPGDGLAAAVAGGAAVAATVAAGEAWLLRGELRASTGLGNVAQRSYDMATAALRCLGLLVTLGLIGLAYWLFPEYHGSFYAPYWRFLSWVGPVALCLAPVYFLWVGSRQLDRDDAYLRIGRLVLSGGRARIEVPVLRGHFAGWAVKAFFLPLMVVYLTQETGAVAGAWRALSADSMRLYHFFYELSFLIDLLFCVVGYTMTLRVLDSHIRSTEPTALGWMVALACYQPFYSIVGSTYLKYDGDVYWDTWLSAYPLLRAAWGWTIIALVLVYALSTVAFGLRFSNLTHRGIVTCGPYRFTKHPAYVTKNLSWWLISVPFVSHAGWSAAAQHCSLLLLLNLVYFLRAKTEEWHLSRDADYLAYAQWMASNGIFRRLRRSG